MKRALRTVAAEGRELPGRGNYPMLSKKHSRPIVVERRKYRWSIAGDGLYVTLAVQLPESNGQRLEVIIDRDVGRYRLEKSADAHSLLLRPVTPSLVAMIVKNGLAIGWMPESKSSPLEATLNARDELEVRRGSIGGK